MALPYRIEESAVTGHHPSSTIVKVNVLTNDGTTAKVQIQDSGVSLRQGHIHTVPSGAIQES